MERRFVVLEWSFEEEIDGNICFGDEGFIGTYRQAEALADEMKQMYPNNTFRIFELRECFI